MNNKIDLTKITFKEMTEQGTLTNCRALLKMILVQGGLYAAPYGNKKYEDLYFKPHEDLFLQTKDGIKAQAVGKNGQAAITCAEVKINTELNKIYFDTECSYLGSKAYDIFSDGNGCYINPITKEKCDDCNGLEDLIEHYDDKKQVYLCNIELDRKHYSSRRYEDVSFENHLQFTDNQYRFSLSCNKVKITHVLKGDDNVAEVISKIHDKIQNAKFHDHAADALKTQVEGIANNIEQFVENAARNQVAENYISEKLELIHGVGYKLKGIVRRGNPQIEIPNIASYYKTSAALKTEFGLVKLVCTFDWGYDFDGVDLTRLENDSRYVLNFITKSDYENHILEYGHTKNMRFNEVAESSDLDYCLDLCKCMFCKAEGNVNV